MTTDCDRLRVGSFYFQYVNAWPDTVSAEGKFYHRKQGRRGEVSLFGFQDIPGGLDLYLTDRAWSERTQSFVANTVVGDGIVTTRSPAGRGFPAGVPFGMGNNTSVGESNGGFDWTDVDVVTTTPDGAVTTSQYFQLGDDGDQIFFYCVGSDGRDRPLAGFSYNGPFLRTSTTTTTNSEINGDIDGESDYDYGTTTSSAPAYFFDKPPMEVLNTTSPTPGLLVMREQPGGTLFWNWEFLCPVAANAGCVMDFYDLRNAMSDAENHWLGRNPDGSFSYPPGHTSMAVSQHPQPHWISGSFAVVLMAWLLRMV